MAAHHKYEFKFVSTATATKPLQYNFYHTELLGNMVEKLPAGLKEYRHRMYGGRDLTIDEIVSSYEEFTRTDGPW